MRPKGTAQELEARRCETLAMFEQGHRVKDVTQRLGVSRISAGKWKKAGAANGPGVAARPMPPRERKLSGKQLDRLGELLLDGPVACGFPTELWTSPRVAKLILDRFGVSYHVDHLSRLLRDLGFTPQKPLRRAVEREEQAIRAWVKRDWPRLKKKRNG